MERFTTIQVIKGCGQTVETDRNHVIQVFEIYVTFQHYLNEHSFAKIFKI